jgi:hypothetical protein
MARPGPWRVRAPTVPPQGSVATTAAYDSPAP